MKVIDVYQQYFQAECLYNDLPRKGVLVSLTYTYDAGVTKYEVNVSFFPYRDPEDMAITYDAFSSKVIYEAPGRRSRKREAVFLEEISLHADALAREMGGVIYWDKPLIEARFG